MCGRNNAVNTCTAKMLRLWPLVCVGLIVLTARQSLAVLQICSGGSQHFCALETSDGSVRCWGLNDWGQLGINLDVPNVGSTQTRFPQPVLLGAPATQIACGGYSSCALLQGGSVKCWGANLMGQLGLGSSVPSVGRGNGTRITPETPAMDLGDKEVAREISMGFNHTCILLQSGGLKCVGSNMAGQLGHEKSYDKWGTLPAHMGNNLPAVTFKNRTIISLDAGGSTTCVVLDDGSVRCWGANGLGQLGFNDKRGNVYFTSPPDDLARQTYGNQPGDMANLTAIIMGPPPVVPAVQVSVGIGYACALLSDNTVKCWGSNYYGQLGFQTMDVFYPPPAPNAPFGNTYQSNDAWGDQAGEMVRTPAIKLGTNTGKVVKIVAGGTTTCAYFAPSGRVKCWGRNSDGVLGIGVYAGYRTLAGTVTEEKAMRVGDNADEMGDELPAISLSESNYLVVNMAITASLPMNFYDDYQYYKTYDAKCAVLHINYIKCWGRDWDSGLLLTGNATNYTNAIIGYSSEQMGDNLPFARLYPSNPPMPPSPSPPNPPSPPPSAPPAPPPPPSPNPPYPVFNTIPATLDFTSLPNTISSALASKTTVMLVDDSTLDTTGSSSSRPSRFERIAGKSEDGATSNPFLLTAIILGSILGGLLLTGLVCAIIYTVVSNRAADDPPSSPTRDRITMPTPSPIYGMQQSPQGTIGNPLYGRRAGLGPLAESCEYPYIAPSPPSPPSLSTWFMGLLSPPSRSSHVPHMQSMYGQHQHQGWSPQHLSPPGPIAEGDTDGSTPFLAAKTEALHATGSSWEQLTYQQQAYNQQIMSSPATTVQIPNDDPPEKTRQSKIKKIIRKVPTALIVSTVNPKLNLFGVAAPILALTTGVLTLMAILTVLFVMVTQCTSVCATTPAFQVNPTNDNLQCVAMRMNDAIATYDGTDKAGVHHSSVLLGKCSVLHLQTCAKVEWDVLSNCLQSLDAYASITTTASSSPSWYSLVDLFNQQQAGRCQAATTIASGSACGSGSVPSDVCWVLSLSTINSDMDSDSCLNSLNKPRCSEVTYRTVVYHQRNVPSNGTTFMCSPGSTLKQGTLEDAFSLTDPRLCAGDRFISDAGVRCLTTRHTMCQEVDGGGAGMCLRYDSSDSDEPMAEPGLLFGPGVLATTYSSLGFTRDNQGRCAPWPLLPSHTSEQITRSLLSALTTTMRKSLDKRKGFLQSGTVDVRATTNVADVIFDRTGSWIMQHPVELGGGPLTSFFTNSNLLCCTLVCPTWLNAIGSAMGFAVYLEMAIMFLVVVIYLVVSRRAYSGVSLQEIVTEIVFNQEEPDDLRNSRTSRISEKMSARPSNTRSLPAGGAAPSNSSMKSQRTRSDVLPDTVAVTPVRLGRQADGTESSETDSPATGPKLKGRGTGGNTGASSSGQNNSQSPSKPSPTSQQLDPGGNENADSAVALTVTETAAVAPTNPQP